GPAYQALGRSLTSPPLSRSINSFESFVRVLGDARSAKTASAFSANDFEPVVFGQYPQLRSLWGKLRKAPGVEMGARMTGSGSALFALFRSRAERDLARESLEGDRVLDRCRVLPASLVSRVGYRRLWRRQLADHLAPNNALWPPQSRYAR